MIHFFLLRAFTRPSMASQFFLIIVMFSFRVPSTYTNHINIFTDEQGRWKLEEVWAHLLQHVTVRLQVLCDVLLWRVKMGESLTELKSCNDKPFSLRKMVSQSASGHPPCSWSWLSDVSRSTMFGSVSDRESHFLTMSYSSEIFKTKQVNVIDKGPHPSTKHSRIWKIYGLWWLWWKCQI